MALLGPEGRCGLRDATLPAAPNPAETGRNRKCSEPFLRLPWCPQSGNQGQALLPRHLGL